MATIFSANFPAANFSEFDNTTESGDVALNNPSGRSTYCGEAWGYGPGSAYYYDDCSALAAGTYLKAEMYLQLDTDGDLTIEPGIFFAWKNGTGAGITLKLDFDADAGGDRRLWLGNTSGDGFYSSNRYAFSSWTKVVVWAYLHATAGKLRLEIADAENGEDTSIVTLPNGSIDRLRWGLGWGSAVKYAKVRMDDIVITDEAYSGWANYGSPGNHNIICPAYNDGRHCRGVVNSHWPASLEWKH